MNFNSEFSDVQRKIINVISYCPISLTTIEKNSQQDLTLVKASRWRLSLYIIFTTNTVIKLMYLLLLVFEHFGPVDFLDRISALLWILICLEVLQELLFWIPNSPIFETLKNLWKIENEIYHRLGEPENIKAKCDKLNIQTLTIHAWILIIGCSLLAVQFIAAPKYTVYTYAAIEEDHPILLAIFTLHEVCFMYNAWNGYLSIVILSSINAVELTFIIDGLRKVLSKITPDWEKNKQEEMSGLFKNINTMLESKQVKIEEPVETHLDVDQLKLLKNQHYYTTGESLIADYKKLMLVSDLLNYWCSYRIIGVHIIGYCQFITDVFIMIQLAKLKEMDLFSFIWFGEDAIVCIFMIFRMFTLMSKVAPASEKLMRQFQHYMSPQSNPKRKYLKKVSNTLRIVSLKLGPCPVQPATVGSAVMMLMNYYLCVALWK